MEFGSASGHLDPASATPYRRRSDMSDRAAIVHLAGLIGIEAHFTDALGQRHQVSDETLLALIGAFGLPADPAAALRALDEEEQQRAAGARSGTPRSCRGCTS